MAPDPARGGRRAQPCPAACSAYAPWLSRAAVRIHIGHGNAKVLRSLSVWLADAPNLPFNTVASELPLFGPSGLRPAPLLRRSSTLPLGLRHHLCPGPLRRIPRQPRTCFAD